MVGGVGVILKASLLESRPERLKQLGAKRAGASVVSLSVPM